MYIQRSKKNAIWNWLSQTPLCLAMFVENIIYFYAQKYAYYENIFDDKLFLFL